MSKSIVKACVRYNDRLYTGFEHGECFKRLNEDNTISVHSEIEQGFVDSDGNFVDRKEAMIIARESGQLTYEPNKKTLISEDLHLNWLNQQAERIAELEEQLKNAPKYTVYSKVFFIDDCEKIIKEDFVEQITINHRDGIYYELVNNLLFEECELFATKEEAQAKLEELKGNNYE